MNKIIKVLAFAITLILSSCNFKEDAYKALRSVGYTDIELTGWKPWACSKDDTYAQGFKGKGVDGMPVEGVVCITPFKGNTIRTY